MKIEVSNGEIVDKYTILLIKTDKITDKEKLKNIKNEANFLFVPMALIPVNVSDITDLRRINRELWEIEDELRECEKQERFDDYFITLARQVYKLNDERAAIKKKINIYTNSELTEEKSYK